MGRLTPWSFLMVSALSLFLAQTRKTSGREMKTVLTLTGLLMEGLGRSYLIQRA
jgi:hypothetical protein